MPLSKEATQRALSILESILTQLEGNETLLETEENNVEDIVRLQHMVDVMKSPLFSTLVHVRNNYEQMVESPQQSPAVNTATVQSTSHQVKASDLELQAQFRLSYQVPSSLVIQNGQLSDDSIASEESASMSPRPSQNGSDGASEFEFQTTFVSTNSHDQSHDTTLNGQLNDQSNYKSKMKNRKDSTGSTSSERSLSQLVKRFSIGRKKTSGNSSNVSLADLAQFPLRGERSESEMKSMPMGTEFKGEDGIPRFIRRLTTSSESSLSSMSSETVPLVKAKPLKDSSFSEHQPPNDSSLVIINDGHEEVDGDEVTVATTSQPSRDILFFMRDQKSQTKIQEILQNREPREVKVVMGEGRGCEGLGVDLVGLSSTGVYIASVHDGCFDDAESALQRGDQLVEVNGTVIENMASFEVDLLLSDIAVGSDVHLIVKYNPSGLADYQRLKK